jgi:hypothetical protein
MIMRNQKLLFSHLMGGSYVLGRDVTIDGLDAVCPFDIDFASS